MGIYTFHRASLDARETVNKFTKYVLYKNSLELMHGDAEFVQTFFHVDRQEEWDEKSIDNPWANFLNTKEWLSSEYELNYFDEYWAMAKVSSMPSAGRAWILLGISGLFSNFIKVIYKVYI